jgi:O-antigen ligase
MLTYLFVALLIMTVLAIPAWRHSRNWGYFPSGGLSIALAILAFLLLSGRI